ncbi:N-acetyltransferase [Ktedonospora formicarum]|uniref:N-acetyltransferase n=2 Tax=Ktedonospora formicarum TaxID=2778364 RepID=A0A8J3HRD8_9CHLR|nr:N-acetyltransferase [Ktedonospora formicarum]
MILTTKRLVLREFEEEDWRGTLAYQSNPLYLRYYPWTHRTESDVQAVVRQLLAQREEEPRTKFQLVVTLAPEGQLIGNAGIRMKTMDDREADIGYELDPRYWGYGYATEIAHALLLYGFRELGLHRIWAWCIAENTASAHVLEKIGMRQEGRLRENRWMKDRWWDTLLYSILEHEWQAQEFPRSL